MKTIIAYTISILLSSALFAQSDKLQQILSNDTILNQIYHHLPSGWQMTLDESTLCVFRTEKYAFIETDCGNINPDSLDKIERTETALIRFRYEEKWSSERIFWTRETNDSLGILLASLPQQMGISQLYDAEKSTRFNTVYTGKTKAEKEKINAFYQRKSELKQQYTGFPNFNSSNYSLMQLDRTGMKKAGTCIYPYEVNKEALNVYILFLNYCENPLE